MCLLHLFFFFQAEDGIRDLTVTGVQTCALPICVRGTNMYGVLNTQGQTRALKVYSEWSERIAKGEVPAAPPRPSGVERNVVVTLWDWATDKSYMHDEIATDKNRPTVNANGPIYGVSSGHGTLVMLDPKTHTAEEIEIPTRDPREKVTSRFPAPNRPSLFWGMEHLWANTPPYNPSDQIRRASCRE